VIKIIALINLLPKKLYNYYCVFGGRGIYMREEKEYFKGKYLGILS
jgi:hypothetical protein